MKKEEGITIKKRISFIMVLLCLSLLFGCGRKDVSANTEPVETTLAAAQLAEETTAPNTADMFEAYSLQVHSPNLAIHTGPGYGYETIGYITDQGRYIIVAHENELLGNGTKTTWGMLSTGEGWINLKDATAGAEEAETAEAETEGREDVTKPADDPYGPTSCSECGRSDVYISRYGLCESCYDKVNANNGQCASCYEEIFTMINCKVCGTPWPQGDTFDGVCVECYYNTPTCSLCGAVCSNGSTLCDSCYAAQNQQTEPPQVPIETEPPVTEQPSAEEES